MHAPQVRVWDVESLKCLSTLTGHSGAVRALAASSRRVFSGSDDTTIKVWDSQSLECLRTLEGHEDNVRVLAVGERYVFSGSWDKSIRCAAAPPACAHACLQQPSAGDGCAEVHRPWRTSCLPNAT